MNTIELEKKMLDAQKNNSEMAKELELSSSAWYRKKTGKSYFNALEIKKISKILNLNFEEVNSIFFNFVLS